MKKTYEHIRTLYSTAKTQLKVIEAYAPHLHSHVVLKVYSHLARAEFSSMFHEAQYQMELNHTHICQVYETLSEGLLGDQTLQIVMEMMVKDVKKEVEERIVPYEEADLLRFLREVSSALVFMKGKVGAK